MLNGVIDIQQLMFNIILIICTIIGIIVLIIEKEYGILITTILIFIIVYIINTYKKDIPKSLQDTLDNFKDK